MRSSWLTGWNDLVCPGRPVGTFVFLCLTLFVLLRFDPVWDYNLTLIPRHNTLLRRWYACVYLGWLDGTIWFAVNDQDVRLHSYVFDFGAIVRSSVTSQSHFHCLPTYTTLSVVGGCLSWLHRWDDLVGPGRTGCMFVFVRAWLWCCYLGSMQCKVIISPSFPVKIC